MSEEKALPKKLVPVINEQVNQPLKAEKQCEIKGPDSTSIIIPAKEITVVEKLPSG